MADIRALIVDDEALARERIRTLLAAAPGVTVLAECSGGRDAVEAIIEHQPDLVFLDVQMPDLDGFQVLEAERDRLGRSRRQAREAARGPRDARPTATAPAPRATPRPARLRARASLGDRQRGPDQGAGAVVPRGIRGAP